MNIEFIEGEPYCRLDGVILSPEYMIELCGIDGEPDITEDYILYEDVLYLKESFSVYSVLQAIATYYPAEGEYDRIANKGYGEEQAWTRKDLIGNKGAFVIKDPEWLKDVTIKPYEAFYNNYPAFNQQKYKEIQNTLDNYYSASK